MESREAIILIGAEKFSQMKGYKDSLRFSENHIDNTPEYESLGFPFHGIFPAIVLAVVLFLIFLKN